MMCASSNRTTLAACTAVLLAAVWSAPDARARDDDAIGKATVIGTKRLSVRERPSRGARLVTKLRKGAKVQVLEVRGGAVYIRTRKGKEGWVPGKYLDIENYLEDDTGAGEDLDVVTGETASDADLAGLPAAYLVPMEVDQEVDPSIGAAVQGAIYEAFDKRRVYRVLTRAKIEEELGSGGAAQFFGCESEVPCLARFGPDLGLKKIFTGSLGYSGGFLTLRVNEVNPSIGAISNSARAELDEEGDLFEGVDTAVTKLLGVGADGEKVLDLSSSVLSEELSLDVGEESETETESAPVTDRDGVLHVRKKVEKEEPLSPIWGYVVLGVGVALAATGSAFWFMADANADTYESTRFSRSDPRYHDKLEDTINQQAMTANVLTPIGLAIAASSAVLFYFAYAGGEDEAAPKTEGASTAARLRLQGGPTQDGGVVIGAGWDF